MRIRSKEAIVDEKPETDSIKRVIGRLNSAKRVRDVNAFVMFRVSVFVACAFKTNIANAITGAKAVVTYAEACLAECISYARGTYKVP